MPAQTNQKHHIQASDINLIRDYVRKNKEKKKLVAKIQIGSFIALLCFGVIVASAYALQVYLTTQRDRNIAEIERLEDAIAVFKNIEDDVAEIKDTVKVVNNYQEELFPYRETIIEIVNSYPNTYTVSTVTVDKDEQTLSFLVTVPTIWQSEDLIKELRSIPIESLPTISLQKVNRTQDASYTFQIDYKYNI